MRLQHFYINNPSFTNLAKRQTAASVKRENSARLIQAVRTKNKEVTTGIQKSYANRNFRRSSI